MKLAVEENGISKHFIPKIMSGLYTYNFEGLFVDIGTTEGPRLANVHREELQRLKIDLGIHLRFAINALHQKETSHWYMTMCCPL